MRLPTRGKGWWTAAVTFTVGGVVGPLLELLDMALRRADPSHAGGFLSELIFLLWPTQVLGLMETSLGSATAGVVATASNITLFWALGLIVHFIARNKAAHGAALIVFACALASWELWGAGWTLEYVHWPAMAVALVFYGGFFCSEVIRVPWTVHRA